MKRFSRKRQAVLDCLKSTKCHPSAEWIYSQLKGDIPDLSFATVYRNLSQLKEAGEIRSLGIIDGKERFDADISNHIHAVCSKCGKTLDVFEVPLCDDNIMKAASSIGFEVERAEFRLIGICNECKVVEAEDHSE